MTNTAQRLHVLAVCLFALPFLLMCGGCEDDAYRKNVLQMRAMNDEAMKDVFVSMRASAVNSSFGVLQIYNQRPETLYFRVEVYNTENQRQHHFDFGVPTHVTKELGWSEGWDFRANEYVLVRRMSPAFDKILGFGEYDTTKMSDGGVGIRLREFPRDAKHLLLMYEK